MLPLLQKGIGIHHGGLLPLIKEVIEILFGEGLVKVYSLPLAAWHALSTLSMLHSPLLSIWNFLITLVGHAP